MMVLSKACPKCRLPVTLGGGMTMQKGGLALRASAANGSRAQRSAQRASSAAGS